MKKDSKKVMVFVSSKARRGRFCV